MLLLEKINRLNEQVDQDIVYARRISHNARKVERDIHQYQYGLIETNAFIRDIERKKKTLSFSL